MLHVGIMSPWPEEVFTQGRRLYPVAVSRFLDHTGRRRPMSDRSHHVLADTEPRDRVICQKDRALAVLCVSGSGSRVVRLLQPTVSKWEGQAPMAMDVNVETDGIGLLSLSSHKIYGPKGIGALYIRRDIQSAIEPQIYGGDQQRGLRSGTLAAH